MEPAGQSVLLDLKISETLHCERKLLIRSRLCRRRAEFIRSNTPWRQWSKDLQLWGSNPKATQSWWPWRCGQKLVLPRCCLFKSKHQCLCVQRAQSELAAHQKKILHVDNHIGISIAGLTADARLLWWVSLSEYSLLCVSTTLTPDSPFPRQ